jgi:flagellar transcriptional activator FlhC
MGSCTLRVEGHAHLPGGAVDSRQTVRHFQALDLARRALTAGARTSTVRFLTGLDGRALRRYFIFDDGEAPKPGKRPDSPERFVKNASVFTMIDASLAYALYRDHCDRWPQPAEALLAAFAHYTSRRQRPELSFDRVFYVICWTERLWAWTGREALFQFTTCASCHCRYLACRTAVANHPRDCPFCKVQVRYRRDPRLQSRFPERAYPQITAALAEVMASLGRTAEAP